MFNKVELKFLDELFNIKCLNKDMLTFSSSIEEDSFHINASDYDTEMMPYVHAGGSIIYSSPTRCISKEIPFFMLLYVCGGSGKLKVQSRSIDLNTYDLLILSENQKFELNTVKTPFTYKIFFVEGYILHYYFQKLVGSNNTSYHLHRNCSSHIDSNILQIEHLLNKKSHISTLLISRCLTDIICDLAYSHENNIDTSNFPIHVIKLKLLLDDDYMDAHTLDSLSEELGINKYTLCRDFSSAMRISPMQYLTQVRIENAKKLLTESDYTIHAIGEIVGIYNTTHFINQFKKLTGLTPSKYRELNVHPL